MIPPDPEGTPVPAAPPPEQPPGRLGASTFTIEGRAAPALFVVGWLASLMGLGILFVGLGAGRGAGPVALLVVGLVLLSIGLVAGAGAQGIERRVKGTDAFLGPSPVLAFVATIPITFLVAIVAGAILTAIGVGVGGPAGVLLLGLLQLAVYAGVVRLLVVDTGALTWREMGFVGSPSTILRHGALGAAWALPIIFVSGILASILVGLFGVVPDPPLRPAGEPLGFAVNLVVAGLLAPLGEELFFRGFATTAWLRARGPLHAVVRGGFFFAFVHVLTADAVRPEEALAVGLIAFAGRVPVGLALGWLYVRVGSIWAPIGLHAAFNAILITLLEYGGDLPAG